MTQYTLVLSQADIVWPGVIQGVGLGLVFVPLSAATFATLSPQMRAEGTACTAWCAISVPRSASRWCRPCWCGTPRSRTPR
jgi:hypothetical protein